MVHKLASVLAICLFTLTALAGMVKLSSAQILTFEFAGLTGSEATANSNTNNAGLSSSTILRGIGLSAAANADRFNATSWALTSIENAVSGDDYMEFTITPTAGNQFSVSSISIQLQRSSTGPSALALRYSLDGYATNLDGEKPVSDNTSTQTFSFTFNQSNSTTAVTYRLYAYAESTSGSGGPGDGTGNDIIVNGLVSSTGAPTISASSLQLSGFSASTGALSTSQNFTVRAIHVTEHVVLTAPVGFQLSSNNTTFQDTVHTAFVVDSVPTQTIHVRQNSATLGATLGNISLTTAGATPIQIALSGVVLSTQPSSQPNLTIGAISENTIELSIGNTSNLSNWIVVAKEASTVDGVPADGTDYNANATFSSGAIIASNNRVVLKGIGTSVIITVPNPATTYHFAVYAYNDGGVVASTNYNETTPGTANATTLSASLGWQINATNTLFTVGFDATTDNVNNGSFTADSIFGTANPAAGQLNSNAWAYSANSSGAATFGGNVVRGFGQSTGGVTSGGIFSFEVSTGNVALGLQPVSTVFSNGGHLTLRIQNKTEATLNNVQVSYILWVNNNEARSTTFAFSHSTDNSAYSAATDASYSSVLAAQGSTLWIPQFFSVSLSSLNVAADGFLYLRWSGTDNGGSGSRDEFAIDDISFIAEPSSVSLSTYGNFGDVLIDGNVRLAAATSLTGTLNLKSGVLSTEGNLTLKSTSATPTANVVGGTNSSITGNVTAERFLPWASANNSGFRFVSHPLASNPVINTVTNLPIATNTLVGYNEGANAYEGISNRAGTWPQGIGYGVWTNAATTLSFTGALQLSDVSAVSMGNATERWNFAGNPFPSTLDWDALTRTDVQNAVWVWVKDDIAVGGGAWGSYIDGVAANGGSRYIAPMQGFMVRALAPGAPRLAYPAAARISNQTPSYQRTQASGDVYRVKVTNTTNQASLETVIRFRANATEIHDPAYDAEFVTDYLCSTPDLYTSDANGIKYSINALPALGTAAVIVPLQLETFDANAVSFTFDASEMFTNARVQLEDSKTATFKELNNGDVVRFVSTANDPENRFRLHFNSISVTTSASNQALENIRLYAYEGALYVQGIEKAESLSIRDISGRTVYFKQQIELNGNAIRPSLAKGTYVVQLVNKHGVKTVKLFF